MTASLFTLHVNPPRYAHLHIKNCAKLLTWSLKYFRRSLYFLRAWCIRTIAWIWKKSILSFKLNAHVLLLISALYSSFVFTALMLLLTVYINDHKHCSLSSRYREPRAFGRIYKGNSQATLCGPSWLTLMASSLWFFRYCFLSLKFFLCLKPLQWAWESSPDKQVRVLHLL